MLENNEYWVNEMEKSDPDYFKKLGTLTIWKRTAGPLSDFSLAGAEHVPKYLWIGCSDARVPANTIIGEDAGNVFVHRNIANLVVNTDVNLMSIIQVTRSCPLLPPPAL